MHIKSLHIIIVINISIILNLSKKAELAILLEDVLSQTSPSQVHYTAMQWSLQCCGPCYSVDCLGQFKLMFDDDDNCAQHQCLCLVPDDTAGDRGTGVNNLAGVVT